LTFSNLEQMDGQATSLVGNEVRTALRLLQIFNEYSSL